MIALLPSPEQLAALATGRDAGPVVMVNLLRFRERALPPDDGLTGREAYERYGAGVRDLLARYGAEVLWAGRVDSWVIGSSEEAFDAIALVRYPSRRAFLDMVADPAMAEISSHRAAGLAGQWLIAATEEQG